MSVQTITVQLFGGLTVTQRYPSLVVQQVVAVTSTANLNTLANVRTYTDGDGFQWLQIKDPNTGLWQTLFATAGQAVVGPGVV